MSEDSIIDTVRGYGIHLLEITGGEPLLQKEVFPLISRMLDLGFAVLIETNGTADIKDMDERAVIIMDVKTPGSGMSDKIMTENFYFLKKGDELKFVITSAEDYQWAVSMINSYGLAEKCTVLLSPALGTIAPAELSQ
jgi:7-carboxy-7-deazaguanine synthase